MKPWLDDGDLRLYHDDVLTVLRTLPAGVAQTCVTSPPYWGLRDYGTGTWTGGDPDCDHARPTTTYNHGFNERWCQGAGDRKQEKKSEGQYAQLCAKCGARRVDDQLGLEPTPDAYIAKMVEVFRLVRRVLRPDGTLWLNIGDSYNANQGAGFNGQKRQDHANRHTVMPRPPGLKPKDLVGIPWRLALALQADGWYLRSDIIWAKPNPMPESVTDRPTKAHEYVFLFSKQPRYFYDADAVREESDPAQVAHNLRYAKPYAAYDSNSAEARTLDHGNPGIHARVPANGGRNLRSVWQIATQPFPEAHFATYPEELVRRCILAGTSERGGCAECGAPWRRVVSDRPYPAELANSKKAHGGIGNNLGGQRHQDWLDENPRETTGWEPSCTCRWEHTATRHSHDSLPEPPTHPQLVLDPFIGSGTTALVARKHGRRSIGIDLSLEYLQIAAKRTRQLSLLGGV